MLLGDESPLKAEHLTGGVTGGLLTLAVLAAMGWGKIRAVFRDSAIADAQAVKDQSELLIKRFEEELKRVDEARANDTKICNERATAQAGLIDILRGQVTILQAEVERLRTQTGRINLGPSNN